MRRRRFWAQGPSTQISTKPRFCPLKKRLGPNRSLLLNLLRRGMQTTRRQHARLRHVSRAYPVHHAPCSFVRSGAGRDATEPACSPLLLRGGFFDPGGSLWQPALCPFVLNIWSSFGFSVFRYRKTFFQSPGIFKKPQIFWWPRLCRPLRFFLGGFQTKKFELLRLEVLERELSSYIR